MTSYYVTFITIDKHGKQGWGRSVFICDDEPVTLALVESWEQRHRDKSNLQSTMALTWQPIILSDDISES